MKTSIVFAYPHDEARRGSAAEHLLNLSNAVDDIVEFWRDLARVGVVCGVVAMFNVQRSGLHVNVSENTNQ